MADRLRSYVRAVASMRDTWARSGRASSVQPTSPPRLTADEVAVLIRVLDLVDIGEGRATLLDLVEVTPGWPIWHLLEHPTPTVVDLRLRLIAKGHRPPEMG